ncbi:hypothetical protein GUJ93_ZPchr0014g46797 [Zizania palustris]|uniref:Uncharacterized protein n=1 Tax=Zizania palustris TaxID=103762 RepID=A0A8J5W5K9_ZIZPA|nr:hypothetical protein GUJ93_ZPchr0014g46797 [Zizania palustris]
MNAPPAQPEPPTASSSGGDHAPAMPRPNNPSFPTRDDEEFRGTGQEKGGAGLGGEAANEERTTPSTVGEAAAGRAG